MHFYHSIINISNYRENNKYMKMRFVDKASLSIITIWALYYIYAIFFRENINTTIILYSVLAFVCFMFFYLTYILTGGTAIIDNYSIFFIFIIFLMGISGIFPSILINNDEIFNFGIYTKWFLADFYKFMIVPFIGFMVYSSKKNIDLRIIMRFYMILEFIGIIFGLFAVYNKVILRSAGHGNGLPLVFIFLLFNLINSKYKRRRILNIVIWIGFIIIFLYICLMSARLIILEFLIIILAIAIISIRIKEYSLRKILWIIVIPLFFLLILYMLNNNIKFQIDFYLNRIMNFDTDISIYGRVLEMKSVLKETTSNVFYFVFGKGFGSTYYSPRVLEFAGSEIYHQTNYMVHNVHIGPLNVWLHAGLAGVVIYYFIFPLMLWHTKSEAIKNTYSFAFFLWVILKLFESFSALRFIGDAPSFILLGYYLTYCKKKKNINIEGK